MTDKYLEVNNCASATSIYEVKAFQFDSLAHYPINETLIAVYSVVDRQTKRPVSKKSYFKIFFSKYNEKYAWEFMKDPTLAKYTNENILDIKPNTWYKIRDEKERDELYFFWKGAEGDYVILKKPLPGPGPW